MGEELVTQLKINEESWTSLTLQETGGLFMGLTYGQLDGRFTDYAAMSAGAATYQALKALV